MSSFEDALKDSMEYFGGNILAANEFVKKYALFDGDYKETSPEQAISRYVDEIHRIESKYPNAIEKEELKKAMEHYKFIALAGSPMAGIGNTFTRMSLSNCTVIASPIDSIPGILETGKQAAILFSYRAGVGINISTLRPEGSLVSNAAKSSTGAWSFSNLFSEICRAIGQLGRRGALMIAMDIQHPDIEKFITMKNDAISVTGANISVLVTDDFMEALEQDGDWDLKFNGNVYKTIKAKYLWDLIIKSATDYAEPGVLFWDTYRRNNPLNEYDGFKMVCTNPCIPGDANILTSKGLKKMKDIKEGDMVWSPKDSTIGVWAYVVRKTFSGFKQVITKSSEKGRFSATEDHPVMVSGKKVPFSSTNKMVRCFGPDVHRELVDKYIVEGYLDGATKYKDGEYYCSFNSISNKLLKDFPVSGNKIIVEKRGLHCDAFQVSPTEFEDIASYLLGFFSAKATTTKTSIVLKDTNYEVIRKISLYLSALGIESKIKSVIKNANVYCDYCGCNHDKEYVLTIMKHAARFMTNIGLLSETKLTYTSTTMEQDLTKFDKVIEFDGEVKKESTVYDITVDSPWNTYWCDGFIVGNCGELGLSPGGACMLANLNLKNFVDNPFDGGTFNFDRLKYYSRIITRVMDDMIDLEIEALENIKKKTDAKETKELMQGMIDTHVRGRRIGVGTMGLADVFMQMGIRYDSKEAFALADKISSTIRDIVYDTSVDLAIERGAFEVFDWEVEKNNAFINSLPEALVSRIKKHGRRHGSCLTNPPTGTCSMMGQTSSGIEPMYAKSMSRRVRVTSDEKFDEVDSKGDKWLRYQLIHGAIVDYLKMKGVAVKSLNKAITEHLKYEEYPQDLIDALNYLPDFFIEASDIHWEDRVKMQAIISANIDNNCSSTINLPEGTTSDVVDGIYRKAYETGCRGLTVYVAGSREDVISKNTPMSKDTLDEWYIRPTTLPCKIHYIEATWNKEKKPYIVIVGFKGETPFEVFGAEFQEGSFPAFVRGKILSGEIIKHKSRKENRYELVIDDNGKIPSLNEEFDYGATSTFNRGLSLNLRSRPDNLPFVIAQLERDRDLIGYGRAVARVLKKYVVNGTSAGSTCPSCGNKTLQYEDGCVTCLHCNWNGCS